MTCWSARCHWSHEERECTKSSGFRLHLLPWIWMQVLNPSKPTLWKSEGPGESIAVSLGMCLLFRPSNNWNPLRSPLSKVAISLSGQVCGGEKVGGLQTFNLLSFPPRPFLSLYAGTTECKTMNGSSPHGSSTVWTSYERFCLSAWSCDASYELVGGRRWHLDSGRAREAVWLISVMISTTPSLVHRHLNHKFRSNSHTLKDKTPQHCSFNHTLW